MNAKNIDTNIHFKNNEESNNIKNIRNKTDFNNIKDLNYNTNKQNIKLIKENMSNTEELINNEIEIGLLENKNTTKSNNNK
jgi:hypothetical protein